MKKKIQILICCVSLMFGGCNSWLDVKPYDQISEDELMKSEEGFQKLLNGIYIELNSDELYGRSLTVEMLEMMGGAYKVDINNVNTWGDYIDLANYKYTTSVWRERFDNIWNKAYALILNCNKILDNLDSRKDLFTGDNYNIVRGEVLALRAMLHFDMLRLFGPVAASFEDAWIPYYTTETVKVGELLSATKVIELVLIDLKNAAEALKNDPVITEGTQMSGATDGKSGFLRYRALRLNYYAVQGLMARVHLYAGNKPMAFACADEVIKAAESGIFPFVKQMDVVGNNQDRIFSSEVLFALTNVNRGLLFKNNYDPARVPYAVFTMDAALLSLIYPTGIEQRDYRYIANWKSAAVGGTSGMYFYKYADMDPVSLIQNTMIPMLRLGEMYLIAAESQSDDLAAGLSYINDLRSHRGLQAPLPKLDENSLSFEYIGELYGEGQLFYYYKRRFTTIINSVKNKKPAGRAASAEVFTVPLPDSEVNNRQ